MQTFFKQNATFREAASTLGFEDNVIQKVETFAVNTFGDIRWTGWREGDDLFIKNLQSICEAMRSRTILNIEPITELGRDADFLSKVSGQYPFLKALNFAVMACIEPLLPCALVATVRNEGPFLLEWLAHYRAIGIKEFYIYTNNNTDESIKLLHKLAEYGIIKLILNDISFDEGVNPQLKAYEHSFLLVPELRNFEWLFYLDVDEFFIPGDQYDFQISNIISAIRSKFSEKLPSCVCYNWNWVGSGGAIRRSRKPVSERFVYSMAHPVVKSLIRPSGVLPNIELPASWHIPAPLPGSFAVNSTFEIIKVKSAVMNCNLVGGCINHYWNKSFEEFLIRQERSDAIGSNRKTELFFEWDITPSEETFNPFPVELAKRLRSEHAFLLSIPSISEIVDYVDKLYSEMSTGQCHQDQLEVCYQNEKQRSFITGSLKRALSSEKKGEPHLAHAASELLSYCKAVRKPP